MSKPDGKPAGRTADYWSDSRRPLASLVFLAPLLAAYEAGVLWLGGREPDAIRNGADYWMRGALEYLGLAQPWLLPAIVAVSLLVWHVARRESWHVSFEVLAGMFAESVLYAFVLVVLGQLQQFVCRQVASGVVAAFQPEQMGALAVVYVGAGIYEEVLFRLCLLPFCYGLFRVGLANRWAACLAVLATSLAFALAHYVGSAGEEFRLFSFVFRCLAGILFSALFLTRGFGITVGTHAAYDLIVGLVLTHGAA